MLRKKENKPMADEHNTDSLFIAASCVDVMFAEAL